MLPSFVIKIYHRDLKVIQIQSKVRFAFVTTCANLPDCVRPTLIITQTNCKTVIIT